jgi:hypothetical protein
MIELITLIICATNLLILLSVGVAAFIASASKRRKIREVSAGWSDEQRAAAASILNRRARTYTGAAQTGEQKG